MKNAINRGGGNRTSGNEQKNHLSRNSSNQLATPREALDSTRSDNKKNVPKNSKQLKSKIAPMQGGAFLTQHEARPMQRAEARVRSKSDSLKRPRRAESSDSDEDNLDCVAETNDSLDLARFFDKPVDLVGCFKVLQTKTVNVLFVGRSGTGKSAFIKQLLDPFKGVRSTSGYSTTRMPECHKCAVVHENVTYQLNILDTPGLKELTRQTQNALHVDSRTDDQLIRLLMQFINSNFLFLNAVVFVSRAGYTHFEDLDVFSKLMNILGKGISQNAFLLLTHAEHLREDQMEEYKKNLREHEDFKAVYEYCKKGVLFSGGINMDFANCQKTERVRKEFVTDLAKTVVRLRENVLQALINCADEQIEISKLQEKYHEKERKKKPVEESLAKRCIII